MVAGHYTDEKWLPADGVRCPSCFGPVEYRDWESDDGAFEDTKYRCIDCGRTWWVEGPDA